jgi:hypothetical protein
VNDIDYEEHLGEGRVRVLLGHPAYCWNPVRHPDHVFQYRRWDDSTGTYHCDGDGETAAAVMDAQVAAPLRARAEQAEANLTMLDNWRRAERDEQPDTPVSPKGHNAKTPAAL